MPTYAPDTNFFLQCAPAEQLDWRQVTQADEVVLLVVREVRKELDRLKSGGNARRSKRARAASSLLRRLTTESVDHLELRPSGPRVVLKAASRPSLESYPNGFHIESADERVVAQVYVADRTSEDRVTFLSHDTVPLEDAAELGLQTQVIPDTWLLDPEPNDVERQLNEMRRRMTALEGRAPDVVVEVPLSVEGAVVLTTPYFPPLSAAFIARAMGAINALYPLRPRETNLFNMASALAELENADKARWSEYEQEHAQWLSEVQEQLNDASRYFTEDPNATNLALSVSNVGSAGAENLIIRVEARGAFHLVDPDSIDEDEEAGHFFSGPPARPRSSIIEGIMRFQQTDFGLRRYDENLFKPRFHTPPMARDRHAIYWEFENDRSARYTEGQCRDFRHGLAPDEVILLIERTAPSDEPIQGALEILVSAGNLVEAIRKTYRVRIESQVRDTEQLMRELLVRELSVHV